MEGNSTCPNCCRNPVEWFCICADLPSFCSECRPLHESKVDFHFPLPVTAWGYVTPGNQQAFRVWLMGLKNSQEKLNVDLGKFKRCKEDLEAVFRNAHMELDNMGNKLIGTIEAMESAVQSHVEAVVRETTANAYRSDYQPTSCLAAEVWKHSCSQSSDPIHVFDWQLQPDLQVLEHCIGLNLYSCLPELAGYSYRSGGLNARLAELETQLEEEKKKMAQLEADVQRLENERREILAQKEAAVQAKGEAEVALAKEKQMTVGLNMHEVKMYEDQLQREKLKLAQVVSAKDTKINKLNEQLKQLTGQTKASEATREERKTCIPRFSDRTAVNVARPASARSNLLRTSTTQFKKAEARRYHES